MPGIADGWVSAAYILTIASALLCVIYGAINWNKGGEEESLSDPEATEWLKSKIEIDKNL